MSAARGPAGRGAAGGPPPVALFDVGNTLAFLDEQAVCEAAAAAGLVLELPRVVGARGGAKRAYAAALAAGTGHDEGWYVFVRALLRAAGAGPETLGPGVDAVRRAHDRLNLWRRVPDGVPEALARLRARGTTLGVVSNSEGRVAELLAHVGLAPLFSVIVDSGVEGVSKPDPEIFRRALDRLGATPEDVVYVGDVPEVDIEGARAAGLEAVLVDPFDEHPGYEGAPRHRDVPSLVATWLDAAR